MKMLLSLIICMFFVFNAVAKNSDMHQRHGNVTDSNDNDSRNAVAENSNMSQRHGSFTDSYANGSQKVRGMYQDNNKQGKWEYWYDSGERMMTETYERGELQGQFTSYYKNGNKKENGDYRHNKKEAQWTTYKEDGSVLKTVEYERGEPMAKQKSATDKGMYSKKEAGFVGLADPNKDDAKLEAEGTPGKIKGGPADSDSLPDPNKDDAQLNAGATPGLLTGDFDDDKNDEEKEVEGNPGYLK